MIEVLVNGYPVEIRSLKEESSCFFIIHEEMIETISVRSKENFIDTNG